MLEIEKGAFGPQHSGDVSDSRFIERQRFIDETAALLECVAVWSDIQSTFWGVREALLYLPDDIRHGSSAAQKPVQRKQEITASKQAPQKGTELYQNHFWSFQNTDQFGRVSSEFANQGQLDLRGPDWQTTIEGSIKLAYYERVQTLYAIGWGGYAELNEADETYNDLNRRILDAFYKANGSAFFGTINLSTEKRQRVATGADHVLEEYTGQPVYNFGCDFVVPDADRTLEQLILDWNGAGLSHGQPSVEEIIDTVERLGGHQFLWY